MAFDTAFGSKDYSDSISKLANLASRFIESSRQFNLRFVTPPELPRLTMAIDMVRMAKLQQVKDIELDLTQLDADLDKLVKKFQLVQRSHQLDSSLTNFLGDFSKDREDAFKKLNDFVSDSMKMTDSIITTYALIERNKKPAKTWISTILSPETTSTKAMIKKAQEAKNVLTQVEAVCKDIRNLCQQTRNELDLIKSVAIRNLIRRAAQNFGADSS